MDEKLKVYTQIEPGRPAILNLKISKVFQGDLENIQAGIFIPKAMIYRFFFNCIKLV